MTLPELFILAAKADEKLGVIIENQKKLDSQNQTIIIMLRKLTDGRSLRDARIQELEKENKKLHKLLEKEL